MIVVSSAASLRVERARAWLRAQPRDAEVVIVAASLEAANRLCREASDGARFGWHRFSLASLAARLGLGELAAEGRVAITGLSREAACARLVRSRRGNLGPLDRIADAPGLARALAATLEELRLARVPLEALAAEAPALADLAEADAAALVSAGLADRASVFAAATAAAGRHPLAGRPLLLLDVPLRSRLEADLVRALAAPAPDVMATCPAGDEESLAHLAHLGALAPVEIRVPRGDALARVQENLFASQVEEVRDGGVELVASPGEAREAVEIARQILAEGARGTRFEEIAVALRAVDDYREPLREAFRRARIPAYFTRGTMRPDPGGRALLALLACRAEQLSAARFSEYLSLAVVPALDAEGAPPPREAPWVPPDDEGIPAIGVEAPPGAAHGAEHDVDHASDDERHDHDPAREEGPALLAPRLWERLLVDAAVIGRDVERWRRRLAGLRASLEAERPDDEAAEAAVAARLRALEGLERFALPLLTDLVALPNEAPWATWLEALRRLATRAIDEPTRVLAVLAELSPLGDVGPVDLDEVRLVLEERLTTLLTRSSEVPAGKVFVGSVEEIRGQRFEVVFAPGLAERVFPPVVREDPLLLDEVRARIDRGLATQPLRIARERLALRLAAGAASRRLVISYPRIDDEKGRARVPSFYGLEVLRAAEGRLPRFDELPRRALPGAADRMGWPAPLDPTEAIDAAEYDLAVLGRLLWGDRPERAGAAAYLLDASPHLARALRFRARRWRTDRWSFTADGFAAEARHAHPAARVALDRRRAGPFAPTALQALAACPYRFYLRAVAGVVPREPHGEIEALDARQRGVLVHTMQRRILAALRTADLLPLAAAREAAILACADEVVAEVAASFHEDHAPAIERIFRDAIDEIRLDLREWLLRLIHEPGWQPAHAELSFGLRTDALHDPASRRDPVVIEGLALRGSIDLVERDGGRLRSTDHKTGLADRRRLVIAGGEVLQPVVYALALEAIAPEAAVVGGRLSYCTTRGGFASLEVPLDDRARGAFRRFAATLNELFDRGAFPAAPKREACAHCDYRAVCGPYEEQRTRGKKPPLTKLEALRREP